MKALILASGEASRFGQPGLNKGMLLVAGKPIVEHIVIACRQGGIDKIVFALCPTGKQVVEYFGSSKCYDGREVTFEYSFSDSPQNTAGEIAAARRFLDDDFVLIYGDTLTNIDLSAMVRYHKKQNLSRGTLLTGAAQREIKTESGIYVVEESSGVAAGKIVRKFAEKPFIDDLLENAPVGEALSDPSFWRKVCDEMQLYAKSGKVGTSDMDAAIPVSALCRYFAKRRMLSNVPVYVVSKEVLDSPIIAKGHDFQELVASDLSKLAIYEQPGMFHIDIGNQKKHKLACQAYEQGTQSLVRKEP